MNQLFGYGSFDPVSSCMALSLASSSVVLADLATEGKTELPIQFMKLS